MKFLLEHRLPRKLRYAKFYFEAGPTSMSFSLDGSSADVHASIGKKKGIRFTDAEYLRHRQYVPAVELLNDDGCNILIRNSAGYEELWTKPGWTLTRVHKSKEE